MLTIKLLREKRGLSQTELAIKMAVSLRTVQNWESNQDKIPMDKLVKIYKELHGDLPELRSAMFKIKKQSEPEPTGYYYSKVSASAGMDKEMINDELNKIPINLPNWEKGVDFINVYGDSMYPKFCSGEIIGIKEVELQYLNYGFAYVVILKDGQVLLKFIKKSKKLDNIILESENKFYEPKEYHLDQIKKVFIIKGVITKTTM